MKFSQEFIDDVVLAFKQCNEFKERIKELVDICYRESGVLFEALKRKNNKSMITVFAESLKEQSPERINYMAIDEEVIAELQAGNRLLKQERYELRESNEKLKERIKELVTDITRLRIILNAKRR